TLRPTSTVSQTSITARPGAGAAYSISPLAPNPEAAGTPVSFTVTALDSFGNLATSYAGIVRFTSSDPQTSTLGGLPADYQFNATDVGQHVFTAILFTAGTRTVTVTDTISGFNKGGVVTVVGQPTTSKLAVLGFPSPTQPGAPGTFTVRSVDLFGNP